MSTWWYIECLDHDPAIRSTDEIAQHDHNLPTIREVVRRRRSLTEQDAVSTEYTGDLEDYFRTNAARFLIQHPKCRLQFINEYGEVEVAP